MNKEHRFENNEEGKKKEKFDLEERLIGFSVLNKSEAIIKIALTENNELISIFVKSTETAQKNLIIDKNLKY